MTCSAALKAADLECSASVPDGCGGSLTCATCATGTCGGGGEPGKCGTACRAYGSCTEALAAAGVECGVVSNRCGGTLTCTDSCSAGTCGGGGVPGQCGIPCEPHSCAEALKAAQVECGVVPNHCGGTLTCTTCPSGSTCGGGGDGKCGTGCAPHATCELALHAAGKQCGAVSNGCGATLECASACGSTAVCGCGGVAGTCVAACLPVNDPGTAYAKGVALADLAEAAIPELSGLVASRSQPPYLWAHNDSANASAFFALRTDGTVAATFTLSGARWIDTEDVAIAPTATGWDLYFGDTGDNQARESGGASGRSNLAVYRIHEPAVASGDATVTAFERLTFRYPELRHDCEAMFIDPLTGDLYFVTKDTTETAVAGGLGQVFVARAPHAVTSTPRTLERLGAIDMEWVSGADTSSDGRRIAVRTYGQIRVYSRAAGQSVIDALLGAYITAPASTERYPGFADSSESVAFEATGYGLYSCPESLDGKPQTLSHYEWK